MSNRFYNFIGVAIVVILAITVFFTRLYFKPILQLTLPLNKTIGNPSAPFYIVEFSDFQCPYCKRLQPALSDLLKIYPNQLKIIYKHYPLESIHKHAFFAAEASECAADQGKFSAYHDMLFENVSKWEVKDTKEQFLGYASTLKLDTKAFETCLDSGVKKIVVNADKAEGEKMQILLTPSLLLNGKKILTNIKPEEFIAGVKKELQNSMRK